MYRDKAQSDSNSVLASSFFGAGLPPIDLRAVWSSYTARNLNLHEFLNALSDAVLFYRAPPGTSAGLFALAHALSSTDASNDDAVASAVELLVSWCDLKGIPILDLEL